MEELITPKTHRLVEPKVGDTGLFVYGSLEDGGYLYEGTITGVDALGRYTLEHAGKTVCIMRNLEKVVRR